MEHSMIDIEIDTTSVSMTSVDEKKLIKALFAEMTIENFFETLTENMDDSEYFNMISWLDDNHDLGCMITEGLDDERIDEIISYLTAAKNAKNKD